MRETVEDYLKRGGKIQVIPRGVSGLDEDGLSNSTQLSPQKRKERHYQRRAGKRVR